jgi:ligand-binding SRPBCC domain-containing protein
VGVAISPWWDAEVVTVTFTLQTVVKAPPGRVFAASLSIDDHLASMATSGEQAIGGVTAGRIGLGQSVTWRARHFGISWTMTSQITELDEPNRFVDAQLRGPFKAFRHEHSFRPITDGTEMLDNITFRAPLGPLGWIAERVLLSWYLPHLIRQRNDYLMTSLERGASAQ